jgi:hypothetical protein
MEEGSEKVNGSETYEREEIHSKAIRAGKRTYFLDVKATKRNDYYLTITESKKRFGKDGKFYYEKHKIFLYKEDFEKFIDGLNEMVDFIKTANPTIITSVVDEEEDIREDFATVDFEDLETKN